MIRFRCYRSPLEHVRNGLEVEREYPHYILENIADLLREWLKVSWPSSNNLPNKKYFKRAKAYLLEKAEHDATIYLLRSPVDDHIIRGSTRIPLKVKTKEETYIIKTYDDYDSELEKQVLVAVSGKIGPRVLHLGQDFYSEEMVDFSRYTNLDAMCFATGAFNQEKRKELWNYTFGSKTMNMQTRDSLMNEMVEATKPILLKGAKMHAELAKLGVVYNHNHWLDEFHIAEGDKPFITDFGTSHLFLDPTQVDEELPGVSKKYEEAQQEYLRGKREKILKEWETLSYKRNRMKQYQQMHNLIKSSRTGIFSQSANKTLGKQEKEIESALEDNLPLAANLRLAESTAQGGINKFFARAAIGSGYDYQILIGSAFQT